MVHCKSVQVKLMNELWHKVIPPLDSDITKCSTEVEGKNILPWWLNQIFFKAKMEKGNFIWSSLCSAGKVRKWCEGLTMFMNDLNFKHFVIGMVNIGIAYFYYDLIWSILSYVRCFMLFVSTLNLVSIFWLWMMANYDLPYNRYYI